MRWLLLLTLSLPLVAADNGVIYAHFHQGDLYMQASRFDDAVREYGIALELAPQNPIIREALENAKQKAAPFQPQTLQTYNGRAWKLMPEWDRYVYMTAVHDTMRWLLPNVPALPEQHRWSEVEEYLNNFYDNRPENLTIPIVFAVRICTLEMNGESPAVVEEAKAAARRAGKTLPLPFVPAPQAPSSVQSPDLHVVVEK